MAEKKKGTRAGARGTGPKQKKTAAQAPVAGGAAEQDIRLGRTVVPSELFDKDRRKQMGLPEDEDEPGDYVVELNLQHRGGLQEADRAFHELYKRVLPKNEAPMRISKSYYRCRLSVKEVLTLVLQDQKAQIKEQTLYRVWPDFPVKALMLGSVATIKADAAMRSYAAEGEGITWAVIDSGIDALHPHFGDLDDPESHVLLNSQVASLHKDFTRDLRNCMGTVGALTDEAGHGTHVAGVIAGGSIQLPGSGLERTHSDTKCRVFEARYESSPEGMQLAKTLEERQSVNRHHLRGIAPRCRLVSLKVLKGNGEGRASDVMRALDYIREGLNDDPKGLRVHGVNLSVGYEFDAEMFACGQSPLCVEVDRLVKSGVVVVTAAGNTGYGTLQSQQRFTKVGIANTINDPGNAELAITVGATHRDSPYTYGVSYFSSKGPTGDGRLKPDLVAPGERIVSCAAGGYLEEIEDYLGTGQNVQGAEIEEAAYYIDHSGTSMAAPHVSGAVAAFLSIRREFIGKPLEVKRIFLDTATPLGRDRYFEGHGLIDLMRAIQSI
jgi:subtilisin family serine protease